VPSVNQPGKRVHDLIMLGSLPPRVRELYGLRFTSPQAAAYAAAVRAIRATLPLAPRAIRHGRNTRSFELVARAEQRRIRHGRPTPQVRA
jgi:uncharacterized protein (DUF2236 family)